MKIVNAEGLACPLPLLRAKQVLNKLNTGESLIVTATDPASERDIKAFAEHFGHGVIVSYYNGVYTFQLTKSSA